MTHQGGPRPLRRLLRLLLAGLVVLLLGACDAPGAGTGTPNPASQGTIVNIGSDTLVNLALAWAETYQAEHPEVAVSVTGGGSGTGLAALINGTADIANASRPISDEERSNAQANGIEPVEFVVARDAIAIVVNPENPVDHLTLPQLSAMYTGQVTRWQAVGGQDRPIVLLSRETNSGTHVYFLEHVVRLGQKDNPALFSPDSWAMSPPTRKPWPWPRIRASRSSCRASRRSTTRPTPLRATYTCTRPARPLGW
jgi:phosphate transport system substrate-binding protein